MNKIELQVEKIKSEMRLGLMMHIVFGYPSISESQKLAQTMLEEGVDFIEIQIPFSDPVADGPTLMAANQTAIDNKVKVRQAMEFMKDFSSQAEIPLLFMTYYNIVFRYGIEKFCKDAKAAGCSGLIIPDIPLDEEVEEGFIQAANKHDLIAIRTISPVSTEKRLRLNAPLVRGFVYYVSRKGVTGAVKTLDENLCENLAKAKKYIKTDFAVGFGISKPENIQALKGNAEIAVVGSAVLDVYSSAPKDQGIENVRVFIKSLVMSL